MAAFNYNASNMSEVFQMLESNNVDIVNEIKQLIYEQYEEVKESWLVNGLYDAYCLSGSARCLKLLLDVREPHERFLLDKITEGLKQQDKSRLNGLTVLGYVIRKQPSWLYKLTQHTLIRELLKILKTEEEIVTMMNALLDLLALMPILPAHISKYLQEIFEVFSRFASWRYQCVNGLPEIQKVHLQVGLYAFFHRLYGMFPCNFLSYLRTQYSDNNKEQQAVFVHTIRPMLNSVTMHPLLVTHSRDLEKSEARWRKMELHDVIVESSRYSLVSQESAKEDESAATFDIDVGSYASSLKSQTADINSGLDPHGLYGSVTHDPLWTPSRKVDFSTPPPVSSAATVISAPSHTTPAAVSIVASVAAIASSATEGDKLVIPSLASVAVTRQSQDSPPEAAIEATPESTPFVTPIKQDEKFKFARPAPSSQVSRHLRLDVGNLRSPQPNTNGTPAIPTSAGKLSPSKEPSPFRFPDVGNRYERRDSLFYEKTPTTAEATSSLLAFLPPKPVTTPISTSSTGSSSATTLTSTSTVTETSKDAALSSIAVSSSALLANIVTVEETSATATKKPLSTVEQMRRPSPIKFTNQRPKQFPIQPKAERLPPAVSDAVKHKMLSLDNLRDSLPDFGREEDDDEVTEITGGSDNRPNDLSTRHITPQMYVDSAATSRTVSRLSSSSQADDPRKSECSLPSRPTTSAEVVSRLAVMDITSGKVASITSPAASSDCKSGGLHPPSRDTVNDFVRQIRGRIRYASLCGPGNSVSALGASGMPTDIAAEVEAALSSARNLEDSPETSPTSSTGRNLRRSSSCPDELQMAGLLKRRGKQDGSTDTTASNEATRTIAETARNPVVVESDAAITPAAMAAAVVAAVEATNSDVSRQEKSLQTDPFLAYPYEHLFPSVLPSWFACHHHTGKGESEAGATASASGKSGDYPAKLDNPYEILDQYVRSASLSALEETAESKGTIKSGEKETRMLREEVALLHSQLLFERHRRETLGMRNRRLLGKTRSSRILEEQNTALVDELQIVQSEITLLFNELETLRRQKHAVEEERAENDKLRDKEIEHLMSENKTLKQQKFDVERQCEQQKEKIKSATEEISRIEAALFNAKSEIDRLKKKDESRVVCERELFSLRKEVMILGELLRKYRERDAQPREAVCELDLIYANSAKEQIKALQADLTHKASETDAYKARTHELEQILAKKDLAMTDQKRLLKKVKEEYEENISNCELSYNTLMKAQTQLECRILELQDQLAKALRQGQTKKPRASSSPSRTHRSSAVPAGARSGMNPSPNIDLPSNAMMSFTVGSPPSSSGGSCGSDRAELIRRGLLESGRGLAGSRSPPDVEPRSVNGSGRR